MSERPQSCLLIFDKARSKTVQRIYIYILAYVHNLTGRLQTLSQKNIGRNANIRIDL